MKNKIEFAKIWSPKLFFFHPSQIEIFEKLGLTVLCAFGYVPLGVNLFVFSF